MARILRSIGNAGKSDHNIFVLNRHVHFRISDVFVPEPAQLLQHLHGQDLLEGRIVELSDGGLERDAFAVVEVEGVNQPVVVPVARIVDFND